MKIPSIKAPFCRTCNTIKLAKNMGRQLESNNLVNITNTSENVYKTLLPVREMLVNYAKAKNIHLDFKSVDSEIEKGLLITLESQNTKKVNSRLINPDLDSVEPVMRKNKIMLENQDELNYQAIGIESHEDNFLRRVYRTVEILANLK